MRQDWLFWTFVWLYVLVGLLFSAFNVYAHDHQRPDLDRWYGGLMRPHTGNYSGGTSCCSRYDCHTTEADIRNGEWWARLGKQVTKTEGGIDWVLGPWVKVPAEVVLKESNPTGDAVICHPALTDQWGNINAEDTPIYCFVPGDES